MNAKQPKTTVKDKEGREIKAGDTIFNPHDRNGEHLVIEKDGKLFIGDYDSPIEKYRPEWFWKIVSRQRLDETRHE